MTWHYTGIGKPTAVYNQAVHQLNHQLKHMQEPESQLLQKFLSILATISGTYPEASVIKVTASGRQYKPNNSEDGIYNTFKVDIEPVYGFVE